jgi:dTDP-4-dehydrorhamnose 3,5-epimerase
MMDGLPAGADLLDLRTRLDDRGALTELFRQSWDRWPAPVQWNITFSRAGVLRGMHLHLRRSDYAVVVQGRAAIGLRDLRRGSPTEGRAAVVELRSDRPQVLTTPPGVLHGFYLPEPSAFVAGFSVEHEPDDDLACHWADPALGIPWRPTGVILSDRDAGAPPLSDLLAAIEPEQPIGRQIPAAASPGSAPADATSG